MEDDDELIENMELVEYLDESIDDILELDMEGVEDNGNKDMLYGNI